MDLKGFEHLGVAWSWPEFEEPSGKILRPAHAWASEGKTRCGEPWPHRVDPSGVALKYRPASAPTHARIAEIRDAEDRTPYLCMECLARCSPVSLKDFERVPDARLLPDMVIDVETDA